MNDEIAIKIDKVSKSFKLPHEKTSSIKTAFLNIVRHNRGYEMQHVLKDLSFDIKKGDFFGIVGRNGSGKSTLLKLLAGIYTPNKGRVIVNGTLIPFIELGVGFNPELTGRENVYLNGSLLGFNRKQMDNMYDEIVGFAELERFMDQKLKNYSSGMQVRLAFSIAIRANTDILVLDEVLAVGDLEFQRKCYKYFATLKREKRTVVLVSHDMAAIKKFCTKCVLLHEGNIVYSGAPAKVARKYEELNLLTSIVDSEKGAKTDKDSPLRFQEIETFDPITTKKKNHFDAHDTIGVRIKAIADQPLSDPTIGFIFQDDLEATVFATNNWTAGVKTASFVKGDQIIYETIVDNVFTDGGYTITAALEDTDITRGYDRWERVSPFTVSGQDFPHASSHPHHKSTLVTESLKS